MRNTVIFNVKIVVMGQKYLLFFHGRLALRLVIFFSLMYFNRSISDSRSDVDFENGLDTMPSFDDNLDHSCDELELPDPTRSERGEGSLKFVSSHFQDDYDSDDDPTLTRDLEFPDVSEVSQDAQRNEQSNDKLASIAVALVSKTLSSAMTTALQSFGQDREGDASVDHPVIFKTGGDSDSDEIDVNPDVDSGSETDGEDFEFLDKSDLEHYENKSK